MQSARKFTICVGEGRILLLEWIESMTERHLQVSEAGAFIFQVPYNSFITYIPYI